MAAVRVDNDSTMFFICSGMCRHVDIGLNVRLFRYSGTSLLRSPTGLGKSDLNGGVTLLQ